VQRGALVADIQAAAVDDRRGELGLDVVDLPHQPRFAVLDLAGVEADHPALEIVVGFSSP